MKVIHGEEIVSQHCLLLMNIMFKKKVRRKVKFRKKLKLWSLRESKSLLNWLTTNVIVMKTGVV